MIRNAEDFGALVRRQRLAKRLTQRELALVAGVGERFVVDLENGKATAQLGKALMLAGVLGIALGDRAAIVGQQPGDADVPDVEVPKVEGWQP